MILITYNYVISLVSRGSSRCLVSYTDIVGFSGPIMGCAKAERVGHFPPRDHLLVSRRNAERCSQSISVVRITMCYVSCLVSMEENP